MDQHVIETAKALRVPNELREWLVGSANLGDAWASCVNSEWVVAIARAGGIPVIEILGALAACFPAPTISAIAVPEVARMADVLRDMLDGYVHGGPTAETKAAFRTVVYPQLKEMNIGRDLERHGPLEGVPLPPSPGLWPFIGRANAIARLYEQEQDHAEWPWPGRLALVVRWLVDTEARDAAWSLPLAREEVGELMRRLPAAQEVIARRLRSFMRLPPL